MKKYLRFLTKDSKIILSMTFQLCHMQYQIYSIHSVLMDLQQKNKINMYNLFQYVTQKKLQDQQQKRVEKQSDFLLRHQQFKKSAHENLKNRAEEFLFNQATAENPYSFEDDHYQRWRPHRQYRDVEDSNKFKGFKTFRHRPNEDMDKFYTPRQRKEIAELACQKEPLVTSGILPKQHISRSQRSQGPYQPKVQFRVAKKDQQYLQPRLRYTNITDKQRMGESAMNFDERVSKIYSRFQASKSRLGRTTRQGMNRYNDDASSGVHAGFYKKKKALSLHRRPSSDSQPQESLFDSTKLSQYFEERGQNRRKSKAYFKLSKTMQMFHPDKERRVQFEQLLKTAQFDREKDLSNICKNIHNENHLKHPIL